MTEATLFTTKGFTPVRAERNLDELEVHGDWPTGLNGTLYRIGPNPQFEPIPPYNPLLGDGMVHAFHVRRGHVAYLNRWVRTEQWKLERKAGRALFATSGDPRQHDPSVAGIATDGVANTNLVWHGGRLLALVDGHLPVELAPETLETIGPWRFRGALTTNMCAHPRIDPQTGEMVFFANFPNRSFTGDIEWCVADATGAIRGQGCVQAPFPALIHDFALTRDFMLFPVCPLTVSITRARAGGPAVAWEPTYGSHLAVVRRDGTNEVRWFRRDPCFVWHLVNAWNDGDVVTVDVCEQRAPAFPRHDGGMPDRASLRQHLTRWQLDWSQPGRITHRLWDGACEYPRHDERFTAQRLRYSYFCCHGGPGTEDPWQRGIGQYDHAEERMRTFHFGATRAVSEPVFVPACADAAEGDGFLLCVVYDEEHDRGELTVLDALHVERGPIARALLPCRVPMGFHGCWLPR